MFDEIDRSLPSAPPTLGTNTDLVRYQPTYSSPPPPPHQPTTPNGLRPDPRPGPSRQHRTGNRFGLGIAVGALAMGTFALGGAAGLGLGQSRSTTVSAPVPANPVAVQASGAASVHELVTTVRPSIVAIHTEVSGTDMFGQQSVGQAAGTGWVLSTDGLIATNAHVVDGATRIEVSFDDGSTIEAGLVGADQRSDLAVLRVDRNDLTPLPVGDSDAIRVGDGVVAIGNALDLGAEPTVTGGIVSAKDRSLTEPNGATLVNLIQTDAAISPGNSGGPLLDLSGRVIGINTAISGDGQNIGFAIAINPALDFIDQLSNGQAPAHALLGVSSAITADGSPGAVITEVVPGSAAADAGLQPGDVIITLDGSPVTDPADVAAGIARHRVGDSIDLDIARDGQPLAVTATLGALDETSS